ncbi:hypothetical protein GCM10007049_13390 [Echinicola pacifica]|uniref:Uncharacterized protein n=1 Tax=Echinicola pacifica TaxID=346377 RepID=A0A918PTZ9_9BACT|nr:hypothetical protein [Echinicola pacifica]GGZ21945.1 hypothetical protein GCM10007049_13390 [Echinicola pacifica]
MNFKINLCLVTLVSLIWACDSKPNSQQQNLSAEKSSPNPSPEESVNFHLPSPSAPHPDAMLELHRPLEDEQFAEGSIPFEFNIKNYPFEHGRKGFQLMVIVNGNDPTGYNMPIFEHELEAGHYKMVAFLVDEEGYALKEYGNYLDREFVVGEVTAPSEEETAFLAINFPRQDQQYTQEEPVVVDFLVTDAELDPKGSKVRLSVNGHTYNAHNHQRVHIDGLPAGEHQLVAQLVDQEGEALPGKYSQCQKSIMIQP